MECLYTCTFSVVGAKARRRPWPIHGLNALHVLGCGPVAVGIERVEVAGDPGRGAVQKGAVMACNHPDGRAITRSLGLTASS